MSGVRQGDAGRPGEVSGVRLDLRRLTDNGARGAARCAIASRNLPPWPEAEPRIRFADEPADAPFGAALFDTISESLCRVLVYVEPNERQIVWLTPALIADWDQSVE